MTDVAGELTQTEREILEHVMDALDDLFDGRERADIWV